VLASDRRRQWQVALLALVIAGLFDLLFLTLSELPATVPVALALIVDEGWHRLQLAQRRRVPRAEPRLGRS
jgi:hypothetical protein